MTDNDRLARSLHELVTDTASRQISRETAHLADIEVDSHGIHAMSPPQGYAAPASGVVMTHVAARSRDIPAAGIEVRVAVWVSTPGAESPTILLTRSDDDRTLSIDVADLQPDPTPHARGQVNDFVAVIIAHMVSGLNVAMQRTYLHESDDTDAEYDRDDNNP
ncbi:hypothetical protein [Aeromicrobium sp.]|uniref:hypothetical protein n=1 Tax=Aeromicrobium sp. TaxID=1871063 RepID=UPI0019B4356B|nr:hypothetical protein [Aeromicrobium sp.]MBC7632665.1 hypothetical protein [Aeromicrobium sp.]